jgi:hypothetical protein
LRVEFKRGLPVPRNSYEPKKGLTQREFVQRGKSPLAMIQRIEDNTLQNITHYALYRLGYGLRLKALAEVAELLQRVEGTQKLPIAQK